MKDFAPPIDVGTNQPTLILGVRTARDSKLILASWSGSDLPLEELVLIDVVGQTSLAQVALPARKIISTSATVPSARIIAASTMSAEVVAALGQRNADALREVRALCGEDVEDAAWSPDLGRLTLILRGQPPDGLDVMRDRVARTLKTEVQFAWPGGSESPSHD